jgi:hypothetical protein
MPIYLYSKKDNYYITLDTMPNKGYKKVKKYKDVNIDNRIYLNYSTSLCKSHILNTMLVPIRLGYIVIINKTTLKMRHFGSFDVLKDYRIERDSELSFVIFYINNAIKIHSGKFDIRTSYKNCTGCYNIYHSDIKICNSCGDAICSKCHNPFDSKICKSCEPQIFEKDSSDEDDLFNNIMLML